jgi:hypothetical protein
VVRSAEGGKPFEQLGAFAWRGIWKTIRVCAQRQAPKSLLNFGSIRAR